MGTRKPKHNKVLSTDGNGKPHSRNDKPAIITHNGAKIWCKHGVIHRGNDKPAIIIPARRWEWWQDGKRHRDNKKPAVVGLAERKFYKHGVEVPPPPRGVDEVDGRCPYSQCDGVPVPGSPWGFGFCSYHRQVVLPLVGEDTFQPNKQKEEKEAHYEQFTNTQR